MFKEKQAEPNTAKLFITIRINFIKVTVNNKSSGILKPVKMAVNAYIKPVIIKVFTQA